MPSNRRNRGPSYRRRRKRKTTRRSRGRRMSTNLQPVSQIDIPDWITVSVKDIPRMTRRSYNVFLDWMGIEVRRWQAAHAAIWSNYIPTQPISTDNSPREYLSRWVNANTSICIRRNKSEERRALLSVARSRQRLAHWAHYSWEYDRYAPMAFAAPHSGAERFRRVALPAGAWSSSVGAQSLQGLGYRRKLAPGRDY